MQLDATAAVPLYHQIENILRLAIENKEFAPGAKLPTEHELGAQYGVSRVTVRKALDALTRAGYLVRVSGKGTFVTDGVKLQRDIAGVVGFSDMCAALGRKPGAKTIKSVIEDADPADRDMLGLADGGKVVVLERIRYADDVPVSFEISRFPDSYAFLLAEDLNNASLYAALAQRDIAFCSSSKTLELVYADYKLALYLNIPENHPLISITSLALDGDRNRACHARQFIVGDKIRLLI